MGNRLVAKSREYVDAFIMLINYSHGHLKNDRLGTRFRWAEFLLSLPLCLYDALSILRHRPPQQLTPNGGVFIKLMDLNSLTELYSGLEESVSSAFPFDLSTAC